ncbi:hypothetical protein [Legionella hackeliae]|uniref:Phosphatase n=1 Tax=Legionella hackeliae TaxID=449 RepID=A0A0A8UL58_LEGHA|nr:hypothetical protein [Legionella hackeliae]KTD10092.1 phosphatase [Legionella hackeliae]CEK09580.1 conserved exported protein of unknown function [Legionella hackeliae]STX49490.1 phosphatase [Legionella hackeliae]
MRALILLSFLLCAFGSQADTMDHYMNISNSIPQMEMKADPQAQAWARSARNVLIITDESIAETLLQANELAKSQGKSLFCLPPGTALNAITLNGIILETYRTISSQQSDKDKMTVSQVAWLGVTKKYPCEGDAHGKQMEHMGSLLAH